MWDLQIPFLKNKQTKTQNFAWIYMNAIFLLLLHKLFILNINYCAPLPDKWKYK